MDSQVSTGRRISMGGVRSSRETQLVGELDGVTSRGGGWKETKVVVRGDGEPGGVSRSAVSKKSRPDSRAR